jgi:membrane protein DedA with SNARE-associated domain/rhodanese-related sulfurtransferase
MSEILAFLTRHGAVVLFAAVFVEQAGVPLPAAPWLLAGGALAASGNIHWVTGLIAAMLGSGLPALIWYQLGRRGGRRVLNLLCRISLEPDSCVRRTEDLFANYGMRGVVGAKFVPGLSTLAPPLAGASGVPFGRFLLFDSLGAFLYAGGLLLLGGLFSRQLERLLATLSDLGTGALRLIVVLFAAYVVYKYFKRRYLLKTLKIARISVDELREQIEAGENPMIVDVRSTSEVKREPLMIRGAIHMTLDEVEQRHGEFPQDREIVLYCSCPNDVSSATAALSLRRNGIARARPLRGGIDAWRNRKYPTETKAVPVESTFSL